MTPTVAEQEFAFGNLMDITERPEIVFVRGHGSWLVDHRGKRYLDFVQGWAVTCLGHCPRVVTEALAAQAGQLITPSPAFYNEPSLRLAASSPGTRASPGSSSPTRERRPTKGPSSSRASGAGA